MSPRGEIPLKIALVSPYDYAYPGGVMSHISYLSKYLIRAGHEVKIIAPQSDPEDASKDDFIRVGGSFPVPTCCSIAR